jgi:hypothetical protein
VGLKLLIRSGTVDSDTITLPIIKRAVGGQCFTNEADLLTALSHTRQQSPEAQRNQTEKDRAN